MSNANFMLRWVEREKWLITSKPGHWFYVYSDFKHAHRAELYFVSFDFSLTVKAAPHECVIRTGQP